MSAAAAALGGRPKVNVGEGEARRGILAIYEHVIDRVVELRKAVAQELIGVNAIVLERAHVDLRILDVGAQGLLGGVLEHVHALGHRRADELLVVLRAARHTDGKGKAEHGYQ